MQWLGSETVAVAQNSHGMVSGMRHKPVQPRASENGDVYRAIFRACFAHFRHCVDGGEHFGPATVKASTSKSVSTWESHSREFSALFVKLSQQTLSADEYQLFNYHFLLGASSALCCRKMNINLNGFSETITLIREKVGKALVTTVSVTSALNGNHHPSILVAPHRQAA